MTPRPQGPLSRDRPFLLYLSARTVGVAGYAVTAVAMPVLVLQLTGSAFLTALVAALEVLPYLLFGLIAGAVADRVDRRRLVVACQVGSAAALSSVPVASAAGVLTAGQVIVVAMIVATCFVWFDAATFGLLPVLVGRSRLVEANSAVWTAATLADVMVPALAGVLVAAVGAAFALGVDSAAYLLGAALLGAIPASRQSSEATLQGAGARKVARGLGRDIREGVAFLWGHDVIRPLTLLGAGNSLTSGGLYALLVVIAVRHLGLSDEDARLGLVWTAVAAGGLGGALLLPALTRRLPIGWVSIGSLTATPWLLAALAFVHELWPALVLLAALQVLITVTVLNGISTRQILTPDTLQSRVNTTARMVAWGGAPFGALLGGAVAETASVAVALLVLTLPVSASAALAWRSSLRRPEATRMPDDL